MGTPSLKTGLASKLENVTHEDLMRWTPWVVLLAVAILVIVFAAYFLHFSRYGLSGDTGAWGQFGDFVGGTANPLLGFITIILLVLTIIIQSKQLSISSRELELSRRELELTRTELTRSAQAQELSEKALRAQAKSAEASTRLTAINFMLSNVQAELDRTSHTTVGVWAQRHEKLAIEQAKLVGLLEKTYQELTTPQEDGGTVAIGSSGEPSVADNDFIAHGRRCQES